MSAKHELWAYTDLATGEGKFLKARSQFGASRALKAKGVRFRALRKYQCRLTRNDEVTIQESALRPDGPDSLLDCVSPVYD